ncbi:MAG: hypothetical protein Q7W30_01240 [Coriobacteriia bacterium]|nr:hypothetical protein [Coriobacteriia bacterium]
MFLLVVKALLAPILLAACAFVAWKWGSAAGGWLLGLPLISGPVSVFLFLEHGPLFAENAARGTLLGMVAAGVFYAGYSRSSQGRRWWESLALAAAACIAVAALLSRVRLDLTDTVLFAVVFLALIARSPRTADSGGAMPAPRFRSLVLNMAMASAIVVGVSVASGALGSQMSGMLTTIPVITAVVATSTHRSSGGGSARTMLSGSVAGMWGGAAFFAVVGLMITVATPALTYAAATAAAAAAAGLAGFGLRVG